MPARTKFTIGTCNLYNLNKPGIAIYTDSDGWTEEVYQKKIKWLQSMILNNPADVWGFQELWHEEALADVFDHPDLANMKLLIPEGHDGGMIVCGAAVREDILTGDFNWIQDFPEKFKLQSGGNDAQTAEISVTINTFSRPVLKFYIKPRSDGKRITVYVAHLKSKGPEKVYYTDWYKADSGYYKNHSEAIGSAASTVRRTAEATALRMYLVEQMKGSDDPVMVIGDLNDGQHSNTLNILSGQPNYILSGLEEGGSDVDLYDAGTLQEFRSERDVYYTHIFQNKRESLDHILVSQEFYDNSHKRIWAFKGMEVCNDHLNRDEHKEDGTTDHGIVRATFEYRPRT